MRNMLKDTQARVPGGKVSYDVRMTGQDSDGDRGDGEVGNSEEEEILNDEVFRFSQRMELYRFIFNMNRIKINCNNT